MDLQHLTWSAVAKKINNSKNQLHRQWSKHTPLLTNTLPMVKRWRALNICTYTPSHRIHFGWVLHTYSVFKPQKHPCPHVFTGGINRILAVPLEYSLEWHISHPTGQLVCSLPQNTHCPGRYVTIKTWGLFCHLTVYCSITQQQLFTGLRPKHKNADCKTIRDRKAYFKVRSQEEKNLPSPKIIAFCKWTICTPQVQLGFLQHQCAISGKEQSVFVKLLC